jgi:hypothetical protein
MQEFAPKTFSKLTAMHFAEVLDLSGVSVGVESIPTRENRLNLCR